MAAHRDIAARRTVAFVGPSGAGKTSLVEALLWKAGAIGAPGSVEKGSTVSDWDPLEKRALRSLNSSLLHVQHRGLTLHLVDTPGAPDFLGQSLPALDAVDSVAIVIHAATGIEPMAVRMMEWARKRGRDPLIVVNRIDTQGARLQALLEQIQSVFGKECLPLNLPSPDGERVLDCFWQREGNGAAPAFSSVEQAHRALVEQVVEVDAAFVDRYLEDGDIDPGELHAPLEQALREGHLIPVCFVSARSGAGVAELLDAIERLLPDPTESNPPRFLDGADDNAQVLHAEVDAGKHVLAHVFKVMQDPYVGKLGLLRVHQGTISQNSQLYAGDGRRPFKVSHLYRLQGNKLTEVPEAVPGDLCGIAKVEDLQFGVVLHDAAEDASIHMESPPFPVPVHALAIEPKRRADEQRLHEILLKLVSEDPCLRLEHAAGTNETVVYGLGEQHLRTLLERLTEVHGCQVETRPPRIAYRETVTAPAEGHHRHKKQTGGAGQFGDVTLRVEPLTPDPTREDPLEFVNAIVGGVIDRSFIPSVEKGVRAQAAKGVAAGHPLIDVRVTLLDGKAHSVDSSDAAFQTAGALALREAASDARIHLLEPVAEVSVLVGDDYVGAVMSDLSGRRGRVLGTEQTTGNRTLIRAEVPEIEIGRYAVDLRSLSHGTARFNRSYARHEPMPPQIAERIREEARATS